MFTAHKKVITVLKTDLLVKLKANKIAHEIDYAQAIDGYKIKLQGDLSTMLIAIGKVGALDVPNIPVVKFDPPQDRTKDYERAIMMIDMSATETIELDEETFNNYVMNEWSWSYSFNNSVSVYKSIHATAVGAAG